tara:strand:- start:47 stop:319 length:273 start_codon:yes stop_codon:yes gene_type:complete
MTTENKKYLSAAIKLINTNAKFAIINDDINNIRWLDNTTPIPVADIKAQIPTVEAEIEKEKQDAISKKASAKAKLKELGLDDEELKTLGL